MADCVDSPTVRPTELQQRILSFTTDNKCPIKVYDSREVLAASGLFYGGESTLTCFYCGYNKKVLKDDTVEDLIKRHKGSGCWYIKQKEEKLVPKSKTKRQVQPPSNEVKTAEKREKTNPNAQKTRKNDKYGRGKRCTEDTAIAKMPSDKYGMQCHEECRTRGQSTNDYETQHEIDLRIPIASQQKGNQGIQCTEDNCSITQNSKADIGYIYLRAENRILKKRMSCIYCMENKRDIVFIPCNHLLICSMCYVNNINLCSLCLNDVERVEKVLFVES